MGEQTKWEKERRGESWKDVCEDEEDGRLRAGELCEWARVGQQHLKTGRWGVSVRRVRRRRLRTVRTLHATHSCLRVRSGCGTSPDAT